MEPARDSEAPSWPSQLRRVFRPRPAAAKNQVFLTNVEINACVFEETRFEFPDIIMLIGAEVSTRPQSVNHIFRPRSRPVVEMLRKPEELIVGVVLKRDMAS